MIYFDNAATTKVIDDVKEVVVKYMCDEYANPSSMHLFASNVDRYLLNAKKSIANDLNCEYSSIIFTSGATEANNMIIKSFLDKDIFNKHFITTNIEHSSVLEVFKELENLGAEVDYLDADTNGFINVDELLSKVRKNTVLISIMYVNNEIGSIQPLEDIVKKLRENKYYGSIHTDATQYVGKYKVNLKKLDVDFISASAHKFHAPKGVGFLYAKDRKKLKPLILGGGQQDNFRSGTLNVSSIIAMAKALKIANDDIDNSLLKVLELKKILKEFCEDRKYCKLISDDYDRYSPYVNSIIFYDIKPEVLVHSLEQYGIMVSSSSACSSKAKISNTLKSMFGSDFKDGVIRVSFSKLNNVDEVKFFIEKVDEIVPKLLEYMKK